MVLMSMTEALKILPASDFVRTQKSFIVSLKKIEYFDNCSVHIGKQKIPIGKHYKEGFLKKVEE